PRAEAQEARRLATLDEGDDGGETGLHEARRIRQLEAERPAPVAAEAALDHRPVLEQPERQRRIDGPTLRRLALEIGNDGLHLLGIQHGQRRAAVRADGVGLDVDGSNAARDGNGAYVLLERGDLGRAQGPDEVLLAQELEERDEVAVLTGATPVCEA